MMGEMDFNVLFCNNNTFMYLKAPKRKLFVNKIYLLNWNYHFWVFLIFWKELADMPNKNTCSWFNGIWIYAVLWKPGLAS